MSEEYTLTQMLNQLKDTKNKVDESINLTSQCIKDTNNMIKDVDLLIFETTNNNDKHELVKYKSLILKIKADHQKQIEELQKSRKDINHNISVFEKIIQLKTGDLF